MAKYVGLDISLKTTSYCVIDSSGQRIAEDSVASKPDEIFDALKPFVNDIVAVGFEATILSTWLHGELKQLGLPVVCMESYALSVTLSAQRNKTDIIDARSIARALRADWYTSVHVKSSTAHSSRLLITGRQALVKKQVDLQNLIRSSLREIGIDIGTRRHHRLTDHVRSLELDGLEREIIDHLVPALEVIARQIDAMTAMISRVVKDDPICRRLMTAPGVGPIIALTYRAAIDDPGRFARSRDVGAHFGLTPRRYQSGSVSYQGRISKAGDRSARSALFMAAHSILCRCKQDSQLRNWGIKLVERRGFRKARVALARKLSVVLHRMWINDEDFSTLLELDGSLEPSV